MKDTRFSGTTHEGKRKMRLIPLNTKKGINKGEKAVFRSEKGL